MARIVDGAAPSLSSMRETAGTSDDRGSMSNERASSLALNWSEQGLVPDPLIRAGIRRLLKERLAEIHADDPAAAAEYAESFAAGLRDAPVAVVPEKANEQHYEVPAAFFSEVLGRHR